MKYLILISAVILLAETIAILFGYKPSIISLFLTYGLQTAFFMGLFYFLHKNRDEDAPPTYEFETFEESKKFMLANLKQIRKNGVIIIVKNPIK